MCYSFNFAQLVVAQLLFFEHQTEVI